MLGGGIMKLIQIFINRPVFTSVTVLIAVVLGLYSYANLGVALVPEVDIPVVTVSTTYRGAGPSEIELLVSKPIEDAVAQVEGVKRILSYSLEGVSFVVIEFEYDVNVSDATVSVSNKIKTISALLPEDAEDPVTEKFDINAFPFMTIAVTSNLPSQYAYDVVEDKIQRLLTQIEGVARVEILGGLKREIHVYLDPIKLYQYRVSPRKVAEAIQMGSRNDPSGHIVQGRKEFSVRVLGEAQKVVELENIYISLKGAIAVRLGDLSRILDTTEERRGYAKYGGKDAILLDCISRPGSNVVDLSSRIRQTLDELRSSLPEGFDITITDDISSFVKEAIHNVFRDMVVGIFLTGLVLFLFFQRLSLTVVVGIVMPTAVVSTFIPMFMTHMTMNMMSTLGLAISIGILVNNSILVLENISRYKDLGFSSLDAAEKGTEEIALSVFSTTATNLGVFIPVIFMKGIAGQFLKDFAITIVFSTLFSLWVAMTLTPMVMAQVHYEKAPSSLERKMTSWWIGPYNRFEAGHRSFVKGTLQYPYVTISFFICLFLFCLFLIPRLGVEFIPKVDRGVMEITLELPSDASLTYTEKITGEVERYLRFLPSVEAVEVAVGGSGSETGVNRSRLRVLLTDDPHRPSSFMLAEQLRGYLNSIPDVRSSISASVSGGGSPGKPIQIIVSGESIETLNIIAFQVVDIMKETSNVVDVDTNWRLGRAEYRISPVSWRLGYLGLTTEAVVDTVRNYITGTKAGIFREEGKEYDILTILDPLHADAIAKIQDFPLPFREEFIPLSSVVDLSYGTGPTSILRSDRNRAITISANVNNRSVGDAFAEIQKRVQDISLPQGYKFSFAGEVEDIKENFAYLYSAFAMSVILTFLMIAAILESYLFALIIMITLPLSAIGVIPILFITRTAVSLYGLLGMIMLVGLVVNNAIIIIDYGEKRRKEGIEPFKAIQEACAVRLRPIVMADLTSIIAMLPLALGLGEGGPYRAPMAIVSIGGLVAGGTLALFAVPPIYILSWRFRYWFHERRTSTSV